MNKLLLPIILISVIMVVGIFAFTPVEQATSAHENIIENVGHIVCDSLGSQDYNVTTMECFGGQ